MVLKMRFSAFAFAVLVAVPAVAYAADEPAPAKSEKPAGEKMICRRETPIGSLIASRKTCMTAKEWQARAERGNEEARKMVYDNQGRPTGN